MMKQFSFKWSSIFWIVWLMAICWLPVTSANAQEAFSTLDNADGSVTITGYTGSTSDIVIPDKIHDKMVTAIADKAFDGKVVNVTSVVFPEGIKTIGESAFYGQGIETLELPSTLTDIGDNAFSYCVKLSSVTFKGTMLETIGNKAFYNCSSLTAIALPAQVKTVKDQAFAGITSLSFSTDAIDTSYGKEVFKNTQLKTLTCKQTSSAYRAFAKSAKKIVYNGPYFDKTEIRLNVGAETTLELKNKADTDVVVWSSSKESVATVKDGVVKGVKAGTATIKAVSAGETLSVKVTVNKLQLSAKKLTVTKGYSAKLSVKNASKIKWSTDRKSVAVVDKKGKVTGKKTGTATITATVGETKLKCKVMVKENVAVLKSRSTNAYYYNRMVYYADSVRKTKKGYQIKGFFANGTGDKIKVTNLRIQVYMDGKLIASKYVWDPGVNLSGRKSKRKTFTCSGSEIKKQVDLRGAKQGVNVTASWNETKTVTREVVVQ